MILMADLDIGSILSSLSSEDINNLKNVYDINFEELKKQGITSLMFDLDSTVMISKSASFLPETIDWFNKNHVDYRCFIERGLAIDATNLNIY